MGFRLKYLTSFTLYVVIALVLAIPSVHALTNTSIALWLDKDDAVGTDVYNRTGGKFGTSTGIDERQAGKLNYSFYLAGSAGVNTWTSDSTFDFPSKWTLMQWVKPDTVQLIWPITFATTGLPGVRVYVKSNAGNEWISTDVGNGVVNQRCSTGIGTDILDDAWHQLILSFNEVDDEIKIYVDGVLKAFCEDVTAMSIPLETIIEGCREVACGANYRYKGDIDQTVIFSKIVTDGSCAGNATCGGDVGYLWNSSHGMHYTALSNLTAPPPPAELFLLFNETFEDNNTDGWQTTGDGVFSIHSTFSINGTHSGKLDTGISGSNTGSAYHSFNKTSYAHVNASFSYNLRGFNDDYMKVGICTDDAEGSTGCAYAYFDTANNINAAGDVVCDTGQNWESVTPGSAMIEADLLNESFTLWVNNVAYCDDIGFTGDFDGISYFKVDETSGTGILRNGLIDNISVYYTPITVFAPNISLEDVSNSIESYDLETESVIEFRYGTWQFNTSFSDDDNITSVYLQLKNGSEDVVFDEVFWFNQSYLNLSWNVSSSNFTNFDNNVWNFTVEVNDSIGLSNSTWANFTVNDSINPNSDIINDSATINTMYRFDAVFTDEHFFSFNVTCNDSSSYTNGTEGLNVQSYNFIHNNAFNLTSDTLCEWRFCDGHTSNSLTGNWQIIIDNRSIKFRKDSLHEHILSIDEPVVWTYSKSRDKIRFSAKMTDRISSNQNNFIFYYHTTPDAYYFNDPDYQAWIVDANALTWFDLNNLEKSSATVFKVNATTWEIRISARGDTFNFESIGELNCVYLNQSINATAPIFDISLFNTIEFSTIPEALFWIFLILLWIGLLLLTMFARGASGGVIQLFNWVQFIMGWIVGYGFKDYNFWIGILIIIISIIVWFGMVIRGFTEK